MTVDTKHMLFIILPKTLPADAKTLSSRRKKKSKCMLNKQGIDGYFDNISPPRCMLNCDKPFRLIERIFPFHYLCVNFSFLIVLSIKRIFKLHRELDYF